MQFKTTYFSPILSGKFRIKHLILVRPQGECAPEHVGTTIFAGQLRGFIKMKENTQALEISGVLAMLLS